MIRVSKSRLAGRPGFVALWRDEKGKKFCRGISTTEEVKADEIIAAMQRVLNTPALLDPDHPDHQDTTLPEAYRAIFGKPLPEPDDSVSLTVSVPQSSKPVEAIMVDGQIFSTGLRLPRRKVAATLQVPGMKQLKKDAAEWKKRALGAEQKVDALQAENLRQSKSLNKHCKVTLGEALEEFNTHKNDVSRSSKRAYLAAAKDFQMYLGATKLGLDCESVQKNLDGPSHQEEIRAIRKPDRILPFGSPGLATLRRDLHARRRLSAQPGGPLGRPQRPDWREALPGGCEKEWLGVRARGRRYCGQGRNQAAFGPVQEGGESLISPTG